jgi:hypothetical protein
VTAGQHNSVCKRLIFSVVHARLPSSGLQGHNLDCFSEFFALLVFLLNHPKKLMVLFSQKPNLMLQLLMFFHFFLDARAKQLFGDLLFDFAEVFGHEAKQSG